MRETTPYRTTARRTDMQLHIVGVRHHITDPAKMQLFLDTATRRRLVMMCEPSNQYDPDAIGVYDNTQSELSLVAYISKDDLPKSHRLLDKLHATMLPLKALGIQPGRHTTLLAYPCRGTEMVMDIEDETALAPTYGKPSGPADVFAGVEAALPNIPLERKLQIYDDDCYKRDYLGCPIPQGYMSSLRQSIERDTYGIRQHPAAEAPININGQAVIGNNGEAKYLADGRQRQ